MTGSPEDYTKQCAHLNDEHTAANSAGSSPNEPKELRQKVLDSLAEKQKQADDFASMVDLRKDESGSRNGDNGVSLQSSSENPDANAAVEALLAGYSSKNKNDLDRGSAAKNSRNMSPIRTTQRSSVEFHGDESGHHLSPTENLRHRAERVHNSQESDSFRDQDLRLGQQATSIIPAEASVSIREFPNDRHGPRGRGRSNGYIDNGRARYMESGADFDRRRHHRAVDSPRYRFVEDNNTGYEEPLATRDRRIEPLNSPPPLLKRNYSGEIAYKASSRSREKYPYLEPLNNYNLPNSRPPEADYAALYYKDLGEWLELTGYHDVEHREMHLRRHHEKLENELNREASRRFSRSYSTRSMDDITAQRRSVTEYSVSLPPPPPLHGRGDRAGLSTKSPHTTNARFSAFREIHDPYTDRERIKRRLSLGEEDYPVKSARYEDRARFQRQVPPEQDAELQRRSRRPLLDERDEVRQALARRLASVDQEAGEPEVRRAPKSTVRESFNDTRRGPATDRTSNYDDGVRRNDHPKLPYARSTRHSAIEDAADSSILDTYRRNDDYSAANVSDSSTRYFMIKSFNTDNVVRAKQDSIWATQQKNAELLQEAFRESRDVILFFSINRSGRFEGYARMESEPGSAPIPIWAKDLLWESSGPFHIRWLTTTEVGFSRIGHLKNPLNENQPAFLGRDGQEIPPDVGAEMRRIFDDTATFRGSRF